MRKKLLFTLSTAMIGLGICENSHAQEGAALNFDGINDNIVIGNSITSTLDAINTFTVEAWVNPASTLGLGTIIGNYNYPSNNNQMQFLLRKDASQYSFWVNDGSGYVGVFSGAGTVNAGTWQHVAGTWNGSEITIYIDGVAIATTTGVTGADFATTSNQVIIGNNSINEIFSGDIDNIRLWTVARSATEIQNFMNCEVSNTAAGLLANYHFNDGVADGNNTAITLLHNVSGNNYNGVLNGFTLTGTTSNFTTENKSDYFSLQSSVGSTSPSDRLAAGQYGDFDNNGSMDLIVNAESTEVRMYLNDGSGNFSGYTVVVPPGGYIATAGDIDNDGDDDFIHMSGVNFTVYVNDGTGNFTPIPMAMNGTGNISVIKMADVNNDNKMDIIVGNSSFGATDFTEIWVNNGTTGNPSFAFSFNLDNTGGPRNSIDAGDIDGDGDADIVTGGSSWSARLFLNNNNDGTFTMVTAPAGYSGGARLLDLNQDGYPDYVNNDSYNAWGIKVRYNDGAGNFDLTPTNLIPGGFGDAEFVDMNNDGFLDVVTTYWGGYGQVYLSNGCVYTLQTGCNYALGRADNCVVVTDFNGDGSPDVFCGARDNKSTFTMNFLLPVTTPALSAITSTTGATVCEGTSVDLMATASNSGTFNWFNVATGGSSLGTTSPYTAGTLTAGNYTYYVSAVNPNGCSSIRVPVDAIVNANPAATLGSTAVTSVLCNGDMTGDAQIDVTFDTSVSTATYLWDDASSSTTEDISGLGAGTYSVIITDDNNCVGTFSITITEPTAIASSASAMDITCNGDGDGSVDLTASGGTGTLTFVWDDSSSSVTEDISGLPAGTYTVTITDDNGCTETTSATVNEPAVVSGTSVSSDVTCNGDNDGSVDLTASGGTGTLTFVWDDSSSSVTEDISGLPAGTYTVTITDDNGCTGTTSATVTEPAALSANGTSSDEINGNDGSINLTVTGGTSGYTYAWTGPNGFTATTEDLSGLVAGTYDVTITDANGCTTTAQVVVSSQVGIYEINGISLDIYPNPSTGIFNVRFNSNSTFTISVHNAIGQMICSYTTSDKVNTVDLSTFERGTYFLTIESENQKKTVPVILTK